VGPQEGRTQGGGLTELVALDIGRNIGVLDERLFTLLVVMAVDTTVATGPLLAVVRPDPSLGRFATGDDGRLTRPTLDRERFSAAVAAPALVGSRAMGHG
jgi:hypothetical protein